MKNLPLILVGGGGHCKSVIDVAESAGYSILGILDPMLETGGFILGYPILGGDEQIELYADKVQFLVTVGFIKDAALRIYLHERILSANGKLATIVASTAHVSRFATVDAGSVIMHYALINAGAHVRHGCIINSYANIEHDTFIGDYCHISTGAMINGDCSIGMETFIGSQTVVANGVAIVAGSVVSAGSVVRKDLHVKGIYAGNPSLLKKKL